MFCKSKIKIKSVGLICFTKVIVLLELLDSYSSRHGFFCSVVSSAQYFIKTEFIKIVIYGKK